MFCKWCGMESVTTNQCSWCHHALSGSTEESADAAEAAPGKTEVHHAPVSVRQSVVPTAPEPLTDSEEAPLATKGEAVITPRSAPPPAPPRPAPPAATSATGEAGSPSRPIIGVRRPGGKGGAHLPAPAMPPMKTSGEPASRPAAGSGSPPRPHLPAPGLPAAGVNRAGGVSAKIPGVGQRPAPGNAPPAGQSAKAPAPASRPAVPAALARGGTATLTDMLPEAEAGGLADGVAAPRAATQTAEEMHVPAMGTFTPAKSKYYPGQVVDPASGTHYDADTGKPVTAPAAEAAANKDARKKQKETEIELVWDTPPTRMSSLVMRFLAVYAGLLLLGGLAAYFLPNFYVAPLVLVQFLGGLLMPIMKVVPWQRDDSEDVPFLIILVLVFGPAIALIIYGAIGLVRQNANPAVIGCLTVSTLAYLTFKLTLDQSLFSMEHTHIHLTPPWLQSGTEQAFDIKSLFINWSALMAMAGWYGANFFHKLDE